MESLDIYKSIQSISEKIYYTSRDTKNVSTSII